LCRKNLGVQTPSLLVLVLVLQQAYYRFSLSLSLSNQRLGIVLQSMQVARL